MKCASRCSSCRWWSRSRSERWLCSAVYHFIWRYIGLREVRPIRRGDAGRGGAALRPAHAAARPVRGLAGPAVGHLPDDDPRLARHCSASASCGGWSTSTISGRGAAASWPPIGPSRSCSSAPAGPARWPPTRSANSGATTSRSRASSTTILRKSGRSSTACGCSGPPPIFRRLVEDPGHRSRRHHHGRSASRQDIRRIVKLCEQIPIKARIIPSLPELLDGNVTVSRIRDVRIDDLLGRRAGRARPGGGSRRHRRQGGAGHRRRRVDRIGVGPPGRCGSSRRR